MKHQKHQFDLEYLLSCFPHEQYLEIRENQKEALEMIAKQNGSIILELPTGTGKTAIGYTVLKAMEKLGYSSLFYTVPTKNLVDQIKKLHPDVLTVYGRNEYQCLYYTTGLNAAEVPCLFLTDCPHRVDQETGLTKECGVEPCPYLSQRYLAKKGGIVVCSFAFYLLTHLFHTKDWPIPQALVIDEAHKTAKIARGILSYEITDYHLQRAIRFLEEFDESSASVLESFMKKMVQIIRRKSKRASSAQLLEDHEIRELIDELENINPDALQKKTGEAVQSGVIDPAEQMDVLKQLEVLGRDLRRYFRSLEYSLETEHRHALNYTYGYLQKNLKRKERVQYSLHVCAYRVAPIIRKILSPFTVSYSATIGDADTFGYETGIQTPFYTFPSDFSPENTRIFLPTDTPNLAVKARGKREPTKVLRRIAKACCEFHKHGIRSLVVVVSNIEREKFLKLCREEGVEAVSYGNGVSSREAIAEFKSGKGDVLVGTVANYGEGVDLPSGLAQVIFFLRPGYPNPSDPATKFEERRFGSMRWKIWNWRIMIEALQVRGRNVRSAEDIGVCIFVSQQFRRFLYAVLPEWLKDSYVGDKSLEVAVKETVKLLGK